MPEPAQTTSNEDVIQPTQVAGNEEGAPPTVDPTMTRRWITVRDTSGLTHKDAVMLNNLEFLSKQVSMMTEMLANAKVGPRSSKASSRRSSDVSASSRRSSRAGEAEDDAGHEVIQSFVTNNFYFIFESFISTRKHTPCVKRTKNTLAGAKKFRDIAVDQVKDLWAPEAVDEMCARLQSLEEGQLVELYIGLSKRHREEKSKGKTKQVATVTASFTTNAEREESQETEVNTPRGISSKRKAAKRWHAKNEETKIAA
ncbi:hypothetical protein FSARC_4679 [Fusarium sarcochroum]|uniref:Uncharacterized protein n=1 Tax=Fusarium sarcochroum TaxID=1208366 RepID=A0A8H4U190_9HYPO|nr:hypothetical protein FSARC_4679 [Fusarium sarcochroum]